MARRVGMGQSGQTENWEAYLDPGERLLWEGEPAKGLRINGAAITKSLFGIPFLAFALFWTYGASDSFSTFLAPTLGFKTFFPMFGILFILVGLYMLVGQYFWGAYKRGRTRYALSDKRAFIASQAIRKELNFYPIKAATEVHMKPGTETSIYFAVRIYRSKNGARRVPLGFEYISDGEEVYRLIRQIQNDDKQ